MATKKVAQAQYQSCRDATDTLVDRILAMNEKRKHETRIAQRLERIEILEWMNCTPKERATEIRRLAREIDELDMGFPQRAVS